MKKIAAILATVMVAGSLMVACGSEEAVVEMEETVVATEEATEAVVETEVATEEATEVAETEVATEEATTEVVAE